MTCFHILIVVFEHFMDMEFCFAQVAIVIQCIIYKTVFVSLVSFSHLY